MPKKILVVDDDANILELIKIILSDEGYNVQLEANRMHNLEVIKNSNPDLVIIDQLVRGDNSSWEVVQKMRQDPCTMCIPIILCTGAVATVKKLCPQLMAQQVRVVIKPFDIDALVKEVTEFIGEPNKN